METLNAKTIIRKGHHETFYRCYHLSFFSLLDTPDPPDPSIDLGVSCKDYKGGRTFNDLSTFAKGLGPQCGPANPEPWIFLEGKTKLGTCVLLVAFVGIWEMIRNPL